MANDPRLRLIVALDTPRLSEALALIRRLKGLAGTFKIGQELFTTAGPRAVEAIARRGVEIFLDLKFHDIPNTVAGAVAAASRWRGVRLLNVHATGGEAMLRAAARALPRRRRPKLLGVTLLTSLDAGALRRVGIAGPPGARVLRLARLAQRAGLDGVVASPREVAAIRRACGPRFLIVVPGIRPTWAARGDQRRVATPAEAIRAGADYLVVGRPITAARAPREATRRILEEISSALV